MNLNLTKLVIRNLPHVEAATLNFSNKSLITCNNSEVRKTIFRVIHYLLTGSFRNEKSTNKNVAIPNLKADLKLFCQLENEKLVLEYNNNSWFLNGKKEVDVKNYITKLWKKIEINDEKEIIAKINPCEIISRILDKKQCLKIRTDIIKSINSAIKPKILNDTIIQNLAIKHENQKNKILKCKKESKENETKIANLKKNHPDIKFWKTNLQELKSLKNNKKSLIVQVKEKQNYEKISNACQEKQSRLLALKKQREEIKSKEEQNKETPTFAKKVLTKISFFRANKNREFSQTKMSPAHIMINEDILRFEQKIYALQKELNHLTKPLSDIETLESKLEIISDEIKLKEENHKVIDKYQEIFNQINNLKKEIEIEKNELSEIKSQINNLIKFNSTIINDFFTGCELLIFNEKKQPSLIIKKNKKPFSELNNAQKQEIGFTIHNLIQKNELVQLPIIIEEVTDLEILKDIQLQVITSQESSQKEIAIKNFN